jgi:hypothetical protein
MWRKTTTAAALVLLMGFSSQPRESIKDSLLSVISPDGNPTVSFELKTNPQVEDKETDPAVLAKLEEFRDLKFGLFIHWGPCSQWGARIAWPLSKEAEWARPDDLAAWVERDKDFEVFSATI